MGDRGAMVFFYVVGGVYDYTTESLNVGHNVEHV